MSEFDELVADFEALAAQSVNLSGNDLRSNRREQARIERLVAQLAENGLHSYNDVYAECRDVGHQWTVKYAEWEGNEMVRLHICDRCGTERLDTYSRLGALKDRKYSYSEGFLLDEEAIGELGGRRRRYWRTVNVQRAINS